MIRCMKVDFYAKTLLKKLHLLSGQVLGEIEGWVTLVTDIANTTRTHPVTNLKPAKSYQFHVSAVNGVGEGQASLPTETITLPQQGNSMSSVNSSIFISKNFMKMCNHRAVWRYHYFSPFFS